LSVAPEDLRAHLLHGHVIPAHPLALTKERKLDERRQRALTRYYVDAGAGGLAVGVHTTQFAIREPRHGLYAPVLELAAKTVREWTASGSGRVALIAGLCGQTGQACREAETARDLGYDAGLLSLAAMRDADDDALVAHCRAVAEEIRKVIAANPAQLAQYRSGKDKVFGFFVGQVMKATQGKANPQLVNDLLKKMLAG